MKKCKSIILIDDDPVENLINSKLLENLDLAEQIRKFANGHEGINYLRILAQLNRPPDLILLDLNMPVMDGFEFLRQYHVLETNFIRRIKVIVLTSSLNQSDYTTAKLIGCDGYLVKPLTKEKILKEVIHVLSFV